MTAAKRGGSGGTPTRLTAKERHDRYRRAHPDLVAAKARRHRLKKEYGITLAEFDLLVEIQGGRCAICRVEQNCSGRGQSKEWCVDHDHTTGKIRGILCHHCNRGLGCFKDTVSSLLDAAIYLEKSRGNT